MADLAFSVQLKKSSMLPTVLGTVYSAAAVSTTLSSRNEPGNTGLHDGIKPDPQRDSFANLPHGFLRKGGDFKVLLKPARRLRGGQECRPALDGPGDRDLRRG